MRKKRYVNSGGNISNFLAAFLREEVRILITLRAKKSTFFRIYHRSKTFLGTTVSVSINVYHYNSD